MEIRFSIKGQRLTSYAPSILVSDTIGYLTAVFSFSAEWEGLNKWLHLKGSDETVYDIELKNDRVEALNLGAGFWELWLHGNDVTAGVPNLRITTTTVGFNVDQSGALSGEVFPVITPSAEEQIASNAAKALQMVESLRGDMDELVQAAKETVALADQAKTSADLAQSGAASASRDAEAAREAFQNARTSSDFAERSAEQARQFSEAAEESASGISHTEEQVRELLTQAQDFATSAQGSAGAASTSAQEASQYASEAKIAQNSAQEDAGAAELAAAGAGQSKIEAEQQAEQARSWAVGGTGARPGEETDNAKYWAEQAQLVAGGGVTSFNGRAGAVVPEAGDYNAEMVGADAEGSAAAVQEALSSHISDRDNPHGVTAKQAGADPSGSAAAVQANLDAHIGNKNNPHGLTPAGIGAAVPSKAVDVTLQASAWSSANPPTLTVPVSGLGVAQNGTIGVAKSATQAQRKAAAAAQIGIQAQAAGSLTLVADGTKPTVNIPATVILLG